MKIYFILALLFLPIHAHAASPLSQYKQFGSVAALAEACLKSEQIPQKLNTALQNTGIDEEMIKTLVGAYNDGYKTAILNNKLWIAEKDVWNKVPFKCTESSDVEMIKKYEAMIVSAL